MFTPNSNGEKQQNIKSDFLSPNFVSDGRPFSSDWYCGPRDTKGPHGCFKIANLE